VQTTGDRVAAAAKFSTGVQHSENNFNRRLFLYRVHLHRNTSTVVGDLDPTLWGYEDIDVVAVTGKCFVDGVVDNFINQVVKAARTGRADIHSGALANSLETFKNLNASGVVAGFLFFFAGVFRCWRCRRFWCSCFCSWLG
jgi:hypothetical protein